MSSNVTMDIPMAYICPITKEVLIDPVMNRHGQSYERSAIIQWITSSKDGSPTCPVTNVPLRLKDVVPNTKLRKEIHTWCESNEYNDIVSHIRRHDIANNNIVGSVRVHEVMHCIGAALTSTKQSPPRKTKHIFLGRRNNQIHASAA